MTAISYDYTDMSRENRPSAETRREKLIRFIDGWDGWRQFEVRIGHSTVSPRVLTDEALEDLAEKIRTDFWRRRKMDRRNRGILALGDRLAHAAE